MIIKCKTKIPGLKRWVRYHVFILLYLLDIICAAFQHYIQIQIFVITKAIFEKSLLNFSIDCLLFLPTYILQENLSILFLTTFLDVNFQFFVRLGLTVPQLQASHCKKCQNRIKGRNQGKISHYGLLCYCWVQSLQNRVNVNIKYLIASMHNSGNTSFCDITELRLIKFEKNGQYLA